MKTHHKSLIRKEKELVCNEMALTASGADGHAELERVGLQEGAPQNSEAIAKVRDIRP